MTPEEWFDGVTLLGQFNELRCGCWLLTHGDEAAVLEMPPHDPGEPSPADLARAAAAAAGLRVVSLLCTHAHGDHFCPETFARMRAAFPGATVRLHDGFRKLVRDPAGVRFFGIEETFAVGGEPAYLVHAPKHSGSDTVVVFRGAACTGDWELNTIRSVHDDKYWACVPVEKKLAAIDRLAAFPARHGGYRIHRVYSVHANDRREGVDWATLMADTRVDRKLW